MGGAAFASGDVKSRDCALTLICQLPIMRLNCRALLRKASAINGTTTVTTDAQ
jgi:hypothetical protein